MDGIASNACAFAKPCAFVASVWWGWDGDPELASAITHLCLESDAYDLRAVKQRPPKIHNRAEDIVWAKQKIRREQARTLFQQAGVPCPPVKVEKG